MERSERIDRLVDRGVLTVDDKTVSLAEPFREDYERYASRATGDGTNSGDGSVELPPSLDAVSSDDPDFVACYLALRDRTELDTEELLRLVPIVDQFNQPPARTSGIPEGFLAVDCQRLVTLVELYRRTIVYAWREDCPPCDAMAEALNAVEVPDSVARLAVYGPDCATVLREAFDATVAPTTLYTLNGRVEARHVGPRGNVTLENELREFLKTSA